MPPAYAVAVVVLAELFGASLWFSVNAVADSLHDAWGVTAVELGYLTSAVQLGFIGGTLLFALSGLADRFSASRVFAACALLGALTNAAFAATAGKGLAAGLFLRFLTGMTLAGIYPIGMKLVVSWAPERAGSTLGWLVGMLVLGTGLPHLVRGIDVTPTWRGVIYTASCLAVVAAVMVWRLGDGPYHASGRRLQWGGVLAAFRQREFRAAALGYFGHMWELYAFWAVVPLLIAHSDSALGAHTVYLAAFAVFLTGAIGCVAGGAMSRRWGSAKIAATALAGSGLLCVVYPWAQALPHPLPLLLLLGWGLLVVADSPQFSALAAKATTSERVGGALTLMNSIGFAISIASIELVTASWNAATERVAWMLVPGPLLGLLAMSRTRGATPVRVKAENR